jgi:hypothetical protein
VSTTAPTRQMVTEHAIRTAQTLSPAMKDAMLKVETNFLRHYRVKVGTAVALIRRELTGPQRRVACFEGRWAEVDADYDDTSTERGYVLTDLGEAVLQVLVRGPKEALKRAIAADEEQAEGASKATPTWTVRTPNWYWVGPEGWEIHRTNNHGRTEYVIFHGSTPVDMRASIQEAKTIAEALIVETQEIALPPRPVVADDAQVWAVVDRHDANHMVGPFATRQQAQAHLDSDDPDIDGAPRVVTAAEFRRAQEGPGMAGFREAMEHDLRDATEEFMPDVIDVDAELPVGYTEDLHATLAIATWREFRVVNGDAFQASRPGILVSDRDMLQLDIARKAGLVEERMTLISKVSYIQLTDEGKRVLLTFDARYGRDFMPFATEVPPREVLLAIPTKAVVAEYPEYYISGPGRLLAQGVDCGHGYRLTDSCPVCP